MKKVRFFGALLLAAALMSGTAVAANGPAGVPYVFSEEVGPGAGNASAAPAAAALTEDEASVKQLVEAASKQANELKSYEADYDIYMAFGMNGLRLLNISGSGDLAYDANDMSNPKIYMDLDMAMDDGTDVVSRNRMEMYLADGYYYMDMDGTKQKAEFPIADIITAATASGDSINMASGMMRNLRMSEENGVKTVSYDYDTAQLNALVKQAMDMAMADQTQDLSALLPGYTFDLNVTSCTGSMELGADNSLIGEDISMIMHYVIAGEGESLDLEMVMIMDYDFTSKGQPVIMPAVDPSAYTEIPSGGATYIGGADALTGITVTE